MNKVKGQWALITGASGGMGADFARQLGAKGFHLVLTARRQKEMEELGREIQSSCPEVQIKILSGDLGNKAFRTELMQATKDIDIHVLVNNAGFGAYGAFDAIPDSNEETMIGLDVIALVQLTKAFAARMKKLGKGYILETASIGAFQPCPLYGSYAAAKAFVLSYGLAVRQELKNTGVRLTVLCPGVTRTGFFTAAKQDSLSKFQKSSMADSATVVSGALKALFKGKAVFVPGFSNRINAFATRFVSRTFAAKIAQSMMEGDR
jgi:short-subunit dehydrogenase